MAYEWIGAAAAAAGSAISAVAGQHPSKARRYSKELAVFNNNLARENWQMQNAYDSPAAQMQRYQEAGLNPNLIYGQQNTGGTIQSGSADFDAGAMVPNEGKALRGIGDAIAMYQQIRSQQIANQNANLVGDLTKEQIRGKQLENDVIENTVPYQIESKALSVLDQRFKVTYKNYQDLQYVIAKTESAIMDKKKKGVDISKETEEIKVLKDRRRLLHAQLRSLNQQISFAAQLFPYQLEAATYSPAMAKATLGNVNARTALIGAQKSYQDVINTWLPTMQSDKHQQNIWSGPDLWKIPGAFLKQMDSYLKSLGLDF